MKVVGLKLSSVPRHMADVMKLLAQGNPDEVRKMLPLSLRSLQRSSRDGKDKIQEVVDSFTEVKLMLEELAKACQAAKGGTEESLRNTELQAESAQQDTQDYEQELRRYEEEAKAIREKLGKEDEALEAELENAGNLTEILKLVGLKVVDEGIPIVRTAVIAKAMTNWESGFVLAGYLSQQAVDYEKAQGMTRKVSDFVSGSSETQVEATKLHDRVCVELDQAFRDEDKGLDWMALKNKEFLGRAKIALDKSKVGDSVILKKLQDDLRDLIRDIEGAREGDLDQEGERALWERHRRLKAASAELARAAAADNVNVNESGDGNSSSGARYLLGGGESLLEGFLHQHGEVIRTRHDLLQATERQKEAASQLERKKRREFQETLHKLSSFREQEATEKQVLEVIFVALAQLDTLRKKWENLLEYFATINDLTQHMLDDALPNFVETTEFGREIGLTDLARGRLLECWREAGRTSVVLELLSSTFVRVAEQHLIPLVDRFSAYLALDGERNRVEIQIKKKELDHLAGRAEDDIRAVLEDAREEFGSRMDQQRELMSVALPALQEATTGK